MVTPLEGVRFGAIPLPYPIVGTAVRGHGEIGAVVAPHIGEDEAKQLQASMVDELKQLGTDWTIRCEKDRTWPQSEP